MPRLLHENGISRSWPQSSGSFIEHYLLPIIYRGGLTREVQLVIAALVVVLNLAVYGLVWIRRRKADA